MTEEQLDPEMLRDLERRTKELPREISPPQGAWKAIAEQIALESRKGKGGPRVFWQRPAFLAAAAVLLVVLSSVTTATLIGRKTSAAWEGRTELSIPGSSPATLAEFTARENDYIATVNALSETIESGRVELAPGTVEKLKESIRIIDDAIIEARRALAADPSNKALIEILSTSYGQKVDLLKRAAEMGQS